MTFDFITFGKYFLPSAALAMSVFGTTEALKAEAANTDLPLTCEIVVEKGAYGPTYKGLVHAFDDIDGSFEMSFAKIGSNSATINQSGTFSLSAGETTTVGQAGFGGSGNVDAELNVFFDGYKMTCSTADHIDL